MQPFPKARKKPYHSRPKRGRLSRLIVGASLWGVGLYGVLQVGLASASDLHSHALCGPWGCGPPLAALLAWHGFLLLGTAPIVAIAACRSTATQARIAGRVLLGLGILLLTGVGTWEVMTWLPRISPGEPTYFFHRYAFAVVTMTDLPIFPLLLAGIVMLAASRVKTRR